MYIPEHFEERDVAVLHALVNAHPLGAWVVPIDGQLIVNHIPFVLNVAPEPFGALVGHVARGNPVWRALAAGVEAVVIFQGPQAYITPSWYPAKREHGKVVPTWNYAVVHAHGTARAIDDPEWLRRHVSELTRVHEESREAPWSVADAPPAFTDAMLKGIVGIEIPIARLAGKWKASQNRTLPDRQGVIAGLAGQPGDEARQMSRLVEARARRAD